MPNYQCYLSPDGSVNTAAHQPRVRPGASAIPAGVGLRDSHWHVDAPSLRGSGRFVVQCPPFPAAFLALMEVRPASVWSPSFPHLWKNMWKFGLLSGQEARERPKSRGREGAKVLPSLMGTGFR